MSLNPVIDMLGRRLRLAVIGGGTGSFIGAMHRQAARRDDRYQIVTGIFSSDQPNRRKMRWNLASSQTACIPMSKRCWMAKHPEKMAH
jgi:hypothetical protein